MSKKINGKRFAAADAAIVAERKDILSADSSFVIREAYKTLRTNVTFSLADTDGCKVILLTSALQSEGKSITSLNLAISLAEAGNRVLVMDCDLRRPKMGRLLGVSSASGLTDLLVHPELGKIGIYNYYTNLDILFSGRIPPNPSELLGSARMANLVSKMRMDYDYIVMDTPPANVVTDAAVVSRWTDGVLFVVRAGYSERGAVACAIDQLAYAKAKMLGFVLNGVDRESTSYGKYRYKGYGRGYGYGYSYSYSSDIPHNQKAYSSAADSAAEVR